MVSGFDFFALPGNSSARGTQSDIIAGQVWHIKKTCHYTDKLAITEFQGRVPKVYQRYRITRRLRAVNDDLPALDKHYSYGKR